MKALLGLIDMYEDESALGPLAGHRPLAAMPYAGRYRLIDFTLSNLVNADVRTVGVLVSDKIGIDIEVAAVKVAVGADA